MHKSVAKFMTNVAVARREIAKADTDLSFEVNDYSMSRYLTLQSASYYFLMQPAFHEPSAWSARAESLSADRLTGGTTTSPTAGLPDRTTGSSLQ
jgi:hypothetical protein